MLTSPLQLLQICELTCLLIHRSELVNFRLQINIDFEFPKAPCYILSIDVQDIVGTHVVDIEGDLVKNRLDTRGKVIETIDYHKKVPDDANNIKKAKDAYKNHEGCQLKGSFLINKVSGNFHVSFHSYHNTVQALVASGGTLDFTHRIHHLSFGDDENIQAV